MASTLAKLHDIHLPTPINWWPLAPGYWLVASLFFLCLIFFIVRYQTRRSRQIKQEALQQLARYQHRYEQINNTKDTAAALSLLLKQVALSYYPRATVASLRGDAWLTFLTQTSKKLDFNPVRQILLEAPFCPQNTHTLTPLFPLVKAWIKQRSKPCLN